MNSTMQNLINQGISIGWKILGAIALWIIGMWLNRSENRGSLFPNSISLYATGSKL